VRLDSGAVEVLETSSYLAAAAISEKLVARRFTDAAAPKASLKGRFWNTLQTTGLCTRKTND